MSEFEEVLRQEFARAARYREPFALLLLDLSPTGEALGSTRDGVRLCDSVIAAGAARVLAAVSARLALVFRAVPAGAVRREITRLFQHPRCLRLCRLWLARAALAA